MSTGVKSICRECFALKRQAARQPEPEPDEAVEWLTDVPPSYGFRARRDANGWLVIEQDSGDTTAVVVLSPAEFATLLTTVRAES